MVTEPLGLPGSATPSPEARPYEERLRVGSLGFHSPQLTLPDHCRHIDVKSQETSVCQLPLLPAQPRQSQARR